MIDLSEIIDFSYSAVMREFRKQATKEQLREFLVLFKKECDNAIKQNVSKPEKVALEKALIKFDKSHTLKINDKFLKSASVYFLTDYMINLIEK